MLVCNHVEEFDQRRERLGRVVCADIDIGTGRADIPDPQHGLKETASLCSCQAGDHEFAVVPNLPISADVPSRVVTMIPAPARRTSAV
jgi:hypothetical protein